MKPNAIDEDIDRDPESIARFPWLNAAVRATLQRARQLKLSQEARERVNAGLQSAKVQLNNQQYTEAVKTLEELNRQYPNTPAVELLLLQVREHLRGGEANAEIERLLSEARGKKAFGRFEPALQLVHRALELDPVNQSALSLERTLLAEQQRDRDRRTIAAELQRFNTLVKQKQMEEALALIEELAAAYPWDTRVADARRDITREVVKNGAPQGKQLSPKPEKPRPAELIHWAEQSIARVPETHQKTRSRGPLLVAFAIGVVAVAVVAAAMIGLPPRAPAPIAFQPSELEFFYALGGPVPMPRSLQVRAGKQNQRWTLTSSDPWLQLSRPYGVGTAEVQASVDPSTLSPGDHESIATVHAASLQQTLIVRLHIIEPVKTASPPPSTPAPPVAREIRIEPASLQFAYLRTGPSPAAQRFRVLTIPAGEDWTATAEESWLLPSRQSGAGTSEVELKIDPSRMATGDHTGTVKITSAAGVKLLKVSLHVGEPELRFDPPVNCHDDQYNGRYTGTITWLGSLNDGEVLTISNKNLASNGTASGRELPGCAVSITAVPGLDIQEPSAATNYRQIRFTNKSGHAIDSMKITWNVKK